MKILLLGASGFIGKNVLQKLVLLENIEIVALEHKTSLSVISSKIRIVKGGLKDVVEIMKSEMPDIIISCARISGGRYQLGRKLVSMKANRTNHKIRSFLKENNQVKFVFVSGSLMYGSSDKKITEENDLKPISFAKAYYHAEKPFVENILANTMILRPCWVMGNSSWFTQFYEKIIDKEGFVPQYGTGENIMSIIQVEDLAQLIIEYSMKAIYGQAYNVFSPIKCSHKTFSKTLANKRRLDVKEYRKDEVVQIYDQTIYEAFSSNIDLETKNKDIISNFPFKYKTLEDLFLFEDK